MRREQIFEAWVPPDGPWSLWARPILFAQMPDPHEEPAHAGGLVAASPWLGRDPSWVPGAGEGAVVVVDLRGEHSVLMGLALAGCGYRPVPLYNACTGPAEVIDQGPILRHLRAGAPYLASLTLPAAAPPAFLLDWRRMKPEGPVAPGVFDNRWQVFPQDFPSAGLLRARGFTRAVLVQDSERRTRDAGTPSQHIVEATWPATPGRGPQQDLAHVLRRWQDAGMAIESKDLAVAGLPVPITVDRPPRYRATWYRVLALLGLRRCLGGGFGGIVPSPRHG
jgi:hypothetical protein